MFRDEFERTAHDIICIIRYGGAGGMVRTEELRQVADRLRGQPYRPPIPVLLPPRIKLPA